MKAQRKHVVVIGAGIVGVSAAIWLRRNGVEVTIVDRDRPGSEKATSYGNAGVLAACSVAPPVTAPGLLLKGPPRMALDPNFPLFLRWSYLPRLMPWLLRYMSHANDKDTRRIAAGLAPITADTVEQHQSLTKGTDAARWSRPPITPSSIRTAAHSTRTAILGCCAKQPGLNPTCWKAMRCGSSNQPWPRT